MGYLLVVAAGVLQGSFMAPMKFTRRWGWENTWLGFTTTAYLVWPWLLAWATRPHLFAIFASTSLRSFTLVELFGLGWGLGALTFGIGVNMLGLAGICHHPRPRRISGYLHSLGGPFSRKAN